MSDHRFNCDRCGRSDRVVERFWSWSGHTVCSDCNSEWAVLRWLVFDLLLDYGGHIRTITRRLPIPVAVS